MYLAHFGLSSDPFRLDPNLKYLFVSRGHEEVIAHLAYGLEQGESFVLITGGIGTGKTLALHYLLSQLSGGFHTAFINVTKVDFHELMKMILDDLEIEYDRGGDNADLLRVFRRTLLDIRDRREKLLVVVDEAQDLDADTLEGLRLLSNLCQPGEQALQIVLAGQPALDALVKQPHLEQLDQRIRIRYRLQHLEADEVGPYIAHRLAVAGLEHSPFTDEAIARIERESRGIPRLVNQLAAKGMLGAYVEGDKRVKAEHLDDDDDQPAAAPEPARAAAPRPEPMVTPTPPPPPRPEPVVAAPPQSVPSSPARETAPPRPARRSRAAQPPPEAPPPRATRRPTARATEPLPPPPVKTQAEPAAAPRAAARPAPEPLPPPVVKPASPQPPPPPLAEDGDRSRQPRFRLDETAPHRRPGLWAVVVWLVVILAVAAMDQWFRSGRNLPLDPGYGFSIPGFEMGLGRFDGGNAVPAPDPDRLPAPADSTGGPAGATTAPGDTLATPPAGSPDGSA